MCVTDITGFRNLQRRRSSVWFDPQRHSEVVGSGVCYSKDKKLAGRGTEFFFLPLLSAGKRDHGGLEEECRRCSARKEKVLEYVEKAENTVQGDAFLSRLQDFNVPSERQNLRSTFPARSQLHLQQ